MKKKITVTIILISFIIALFPIIPKNNGDYIDNLIAKYNPTGASVAIIENGKITKIKNYGYANKDKNLKVSNDTQFKIASISKSITSYAIMQLVDQKKLDLDKPVNDYLKKWKIPKSKYDENKVTLRTLMSHTSGIKDSDECGYTLPFPTIDKALKDRKIELIREPGKQFEYSSFSGLGICQLVIEDVTGEKFEDYMINHIFTKLNMNNTNYNNSNDKGTFAVPYAGFNKAINVTPIVMNGAGGVATTSHDLALFDIALMDYYKNGNREMFTAQKNTQSTGGKYGLGIIPRKLSNGKTVYEHNGTLTGWNAQMVMEPESRNGLVVLTNSDKAYYLTYALMEKWGEKVVGAKIVDPQMKQIRNIVSVIIAVLCSILIVSLSSFIMRVRSNKLTLVKKEKQVKRVIISSSICLILLAVFFVFMYSDLPFKWFFNQSNNFIFTYFPPTFMWISILLIAINILIVLRSRYKKA